jgi:hypothetical protein
MSISKKSDSIFVTLLIDFTIIKTFYPLRYI